MMGHFESGTFQELDLLYVRILFLGGHTVDVP
jgi:hypothetical protein